MKKAQENQTASSATQWWAISLTLPQKPLQPQYKSPNFGGTVTPLATSLNGLTVAFGFLIAPPETATAELPTFHVAPNKVSPNDRIWHEVDQFLKDWDASCAADTIDDAWLVEVHEGWNKRLDDVYGFDGW